MQLSNKSKMSFGAGVVLCCIGVLYFLVGINSVGPGEIGVQFKVIGANKGMQKEPLTKGFNWIDPFVYDVDIYNTRFQKYEADTMNMDSATNDGQPIFIDISLEMGLNGNLVPLLHTELGKDYYKEIILPAVRATVRNATASTSSDVIYTNIGRDIVQNYFQDIIKERYGKYGIICNVNVRDVRFKNEEFIAMLETKALAAQNVQVEENNAAAAQQTAVKIANLAEGEKQQRIKIAEAGREEQRLAGEGRRLADEEKAKGLLAIAKAKAEGTRLRREALAGAGGDQLVSIAWAENLGPNVKVYGIPTGAPGTSSLMDLNGLMAGAFRGMGGGGGK